MIGRLVELCADNRLVVFVATALLACWGAWALSHAKLDALPDLSDRQVIVLTEWEGRSRTSWRRRSPTPLVSKLLGAPGVKVVRGQSFFGTSFVYVIFEDGTDLYWARSRTLEVLNGLGDTLPDDVTPALGPDASGVGWVYAYALVDETGNTDLQELRALQDWNLKYVLESVPGVAEVASVGGFVKQYQIELDPIRLSSRTTSRSSRSSTRSGAATTTSAGGSWSSAPPSTWSAAGATSARSTICAEIVLRSEGGAPIQLGDIADVKIGAEPRRGLAELDGTGRDRRSDRRRAATARTRSTWSPG